MAFTSDLLTGLAQLLDDAGVGTYSPVAASTVEPAITVINLPPAPERVICLTDYPVSDDPSLADVIVGVQVRIRGTRDPLVASNIRDDVYDQLHGLAGVIINGVPVAHIYRQSTIPLGPDGLGRYERTENYYVHASRAGANTDE